MSSTSSSYIWTFMSRIGGQVIYLLTTMVLARLLSPDDFGMIGVLSIIFMVANTLSDAGLGGALMKEENLDRKNCGTIFLFNSIVSLSLYVIIFCLSDFIESFYEIEGLAKVARLMGLVFVFNALNLVPQNILRYNLKFKELSIISIISIVLAAIISIISALLHAGVYALVIYQLTQSISSVIMTYTATQYRISICFDKAAFRRMFSFGIFTTFSMVIDTIYENMIAAVFGKFMSVTSAGYVSQAKKLEEAASLSLIGTVNNTSFPLLAKLANDKQVFVGSVKTLIKKIPLLIYPLLIIVMVYAKEIITLMFGARWLPASEYLAIIIFAGFFIISDAICRNAIKALGAVQVLFYTTLAKRLIGCSVIIICGFISVNLILYAYVASAILGLIISSVALAKCLDDNYIKWIWISVSVLIPVIPICFLLEADYYLFKELSINIPLACLILCIYYFVVLPIFGVDAKSYVKKITARK